MNAPHRPTTIVGVAVAALLAGTLTALPVATAPAAAADADRYLVSRTNSGSSTAPSLSSDGQHVAFTSTEALAPADTNTATDVYLSSADQGSSDPFSGVPQLVSRPTGAGVANAASSEAVVSADGRYVAFTSAATNLVAGGTTADRRHIYVRDTVLGTTTLIAPAGAEANGDSFDADISDNGRWIVFTSSASDFIAGDADGFDDVIVADRDADGDGVFSSFTFYSPTEIDSFNSGDASISGNGAWVIYRGTDDPVDPTRAPGGWLKKATVGPNLEVQLLFRYTTASAIDATGDVVVAVTSAGECGGYSVIAASWVTGDVWHGVAVGESVYMDEAGAIGEIAVSSDGSSIAWTSTQPVITFGTATALSAPVVRVGQPSWSDAWGMTGVETVECSTISPEEIAEYGIGADPSLSASGRTIALATPQPDLATGAASAVLAIDRHTNANGLAVSSTMERVDPPSYMTAIDTASISPSTVRDYGAALANAPLHKTPLHKTPLHKTPLHKTPLHKTPLHKTPLHKTPLHKTPLHKTDVPGGWPELLINTPFEGMSELTVTLGELLDWAESAADSADADERAAAARILEITLDDIDVDASGIGALSLGSLVLGDAPLAAIPVRAGGTPTTDWQRIVVAQGVDYPIESDTTLAEIDFAGVDVGRTGVDAVPLRSLPVSATNLGEFALDDLLLDDTILGELRIDELSDPSAIVTGDATGTLSEAVADDRLRDGVTAGDLARVAPERIILGDVLAALLDRASYPWEQISAASLPAAQAATISTWKCATTTCNHMVRFRYSFDPGPGEALDFPQAIAAMSMPDGTTPAGLRRDGAGPGYAESQTEDALPPGDYTSFRSELTYPLGDMKAGTVFGLMTMYTITSLPGEGSTTGTLTVGDDSASHTMYYSLPLDGFDTTDRNRNADGSWVSETRTTLEEGLVYYEWISPLYKELDDDGNTVEGPAADDDWYIVTPPGDDQRLVISTNATDGQIAMGLYREASGVSGLGTPSGGSATGTGSTEQSAGTTGAPSTSGTDTVQEVAGQVLVDQASMSGMGSASVEASAAEVGSSPMLLRVTSGNGSPSAALYALRVQYIEEPVGPRCAPWTPAQTADPGQLGASDPIDGDTNTVYLVDTQRFGDTWGAQAAADVRDQLATLDGVGGVKGAVISIDESPDVRSARATLDEDPCSMTARTDLTKAINRYVSDVLGSERSHITSIVVVGGDDIIPLAPIAEHIDQFTEVSHAADLRRSDPNCPDSVADGEIDPCATPIQAAAATSHILSDDPYGLATAYDTVGGTLYVPTAAIGRLVEDPAQITATIARFRVSGGVLQAGSTLTGGYGAWAELPELVAENLDWRSTADTDLGTSWDKTRVGETLFPAGKTAGVVSLNAHFDERALLPGVPNAADNRYTPDQLYTAASITDTQAISDSLVFTIGCHAGSNLPASYYGADATDWVDVFSDAAGFVGNTGYGLANDTRTALTERLLALYADWLGVTTDAGALTTGGSLVQAKRAYLAQLGVYGGYDEKVLMQAVYYGLPMYTLAAIDPAKTAPLPEVPSDLDDTRSLGGNLLGAGLSLQPTFTPTSGGDGTTVMVVNGDESAIALVPGEPVLPKLTYLLDPAPSGTKARGAIIRDLTSAFSDAVTPLVADVTAGVVDTDGTIRSDIAFPSTFAHITTQQTPEGARDLLVVTPARVQARVGGTGTFELFTDLDVDIVYGPSSSDDELAPAFTSSGIRQSGGEDDQRRTLEVTVDGTGSDVSSVLALVQEKGSTEWTPYDLLRDSQGWYVQLPTSGEIRWFLQAVDAAGNVGIDTGRGHLDSWGADAPELSDIGTHPPIETGERVLRSVDVTDAVVDDRLTATYEIVAADGSVVASGAAQVGPGIDGVTRATLDARVDLPGTHTVTLTVCRGGACTEASFELVVRVPNHAPTAAVTVTSSTTDVGPTSVLTAHATAADEDGDPVEISYRWLRNGVPIDGASAATLALTGIAQSGDEITVEATASDGSLESGAARASVVVAKTPDPPVITVTAANALGAYASGSWSRSAVSVVFTCTSGVAVITCPAAQTITADTTAGPLTVSGTMRDILGREASAQVVVRVDRTAPALASVVTPNPVVQGKPATANPNATDAASGVATQSCTQPTTSTPGDRTVTCTATDVAGNTSTKSVAYKVTPAKCVGDADRTLLVSVNADGSSVFARLSGVPLVFRACDAAGKAIGTSGFVVSVTQVSSAALPGTPKINELLYLVPTVKPVYVKLTGTWVGSLGSATLAGGKKYTYRVALADGTSFTFTFGMR